MDIYPPLRQREALLRFAKALGCRDNALRRDENGDWRISGSKGHLYAVPGTLDERGREGFQMFVLNWSANGWNRARKTPSEFASLTNDGDDEGALLHGGGFRQAKRQASSGIGSASPRKPSTATRCWRANASWP